MTVQSFAIASGSSYNRGAATKELDSSYYQQAVVDARAAIGKVPGSGAVRGVWMLNGTTYAFRDDEAGRYCRFWKATTSGWHEVDMGQTIRYQNGTNGIEEGDTLIGAETGATATVKRVRLETGDWTTGDAAGTLTLYDVNGAFRQGEALVVNDGGFSVGFSSGFNTVSSAIAVDWPTINRLLPGGHFEFDNYAFKGSATSYRMYGCDGINQAFEFDGETFTWIYTGAEPSVPKYVKGHKQHLLLSYPNGSLQITNLGEPLVVNAATGGAAEVGLGDEITGLVSEYKGVAVIYCRNRTAILYGSSSADWQQVTISHEAGAYDRTAQHMTQAVAIDRRGIKSVQAVQEFGDFSIGISSEMVRPYIDRLLKNGVTVKASLRIKAKDQYRLFLSDGQCVVMSLASGQPEFTLIGYGLAVERAYSCEDTDGSERLFVCADDGYVYEADAGFSLDGSSLFAFIRLCFDHQGAPTVNKRYPSVTLEGDFEGDTTLSVMAEYDYGGSFTPTPEQVFEISGGGAFWDDDMVWDEFVWDAPVHSQAKAYIDGFGANVGLVFASDSIFEPPHVLQAYTLHLSTRGLRR